jgi:hypothetical protein
MEASLHIFGHFWIGQSVVKGDGSVQGVDNNPTVSAGGKMALDLLA